MTVYNLKSTLNFGKHKDETIAEVLKDDPDYLAWCCDTIDWFELDHETDEALEIALWDSEESQDFWSLDDKF